MCIRDRDDVIMFAELIEKAGFLQVSSNVEGARIFVDGSFKGKAPLTVAAAPGLREVSAKADEHKMTKMTVPVSYTHLDVYKRQP